MKGSYKTQRDTITRKKKKGGIAAHNRNQKLYERKMSSEYYFLNHNAKKYIQFTIFTELKRRKVALPKCGYSVEETNRIQNVLTKDMVSSEESAGENENIPEKTLLVKKYVWHSRKYRRRIRKLDRKARETEKLAAKRMRWRRIEGKISDSTPPASLTPEDGWVIAPEDEWGVISDEE